MRKKCESAVREALLELMRKIYLAYGENVVNVETLEEGPHGEVDVDEAAAKVKAAGETCDDFERGLRTRLARGRRGVETDEFAGPGCGVRKDLGDLEGVRLDVLGETRPRKRQIVPHQIVDGESRD